MRVAADLFLVPHGAQKLFGWFGGYGLEATGQFFAISLALIAGVIEVFGGLALAFGFGTRIASTRVPDCPKAAGLLRFWIS